MQFSDFKQAAAMQRQIVTVTLMASSFRKIFLRTT